MWRMLQQPESDDYVVATGESHTVREFVERAFEHVGLDWQEYVEIDPNYYRAAAVDQLMGDASKAQLCSSTAVAVGDDEYERWESSQPRPLGSVLQRLLVEGARKS
jgi:nucleoside-diphosphate-sugar epimerase